MTFLGTLPKPGRLATLGHECALTWGQDADGHEEHVLLFVKVQLLQANLEFHERLEQVHAVAGWEEKGPLAQPALEQVLPQLEGQVWSSAAPLSAQQRAGTVEGDFQYSLKHVGF